MSSSTMNQLLDLTADAAVDERIEIYARRTATVKCSQSSRGTMDQEASEHWFIEIATADATGYGSAVTTASGSPSLQQALLDARHLRRLAPMSAPDRKNRMASPPQGASFSTYPSAAGVRQLVHGALARSSDTTVTASLSSRSTMIADSDGWCGSFESHEAQIHLKSEKVHGAIGTHLAPGLTSLDLDSAESELSHTLVSARLGRTTVAEIDWLLLSPLACAQLLSRLRYGFFRDVFERDGASLGEMIGAPETSIHDGDAGWAQVPFDDDGVEARRIQLVDGGRISAYIDDESNAHGRKWKGDWRTGSNFAPLCLGFGGAHEETIDVAELPGTGICVDRITGGRGITDWNHTPLPLSMAGCAVRDGRRQGQTTMVGDMVARSLLQTIRAVRGRARLFRIGGLVSGRQVLVGGESLK